MSGGGQHEWWEGKKREKLREHIEKAWRGGETRRTGRDSSRANKRHPDNWVLQLLSQTFDRPLPT